MPGNSSSLTKSGSALFYLMELRLFRLLALNLSKALPSFLFPSSGEFISKRVSAPELFTWTEFYFESKSFGISPSALSLFLDLAAFWVPRPENLRARAVIGPLTPSFFSAKWVSITLFYLSLPLPSSGSSSSERYSVMNGFISPSYKSNAAPKF